MENNNFQYTYSATEQDEIKRIKKKYTPKSETEISIEKLRSLDKNAERPGVIVSLILGITGSLLLGLGMCCTMVWTNLFILGIIIGIIGIVILSCAYPAYKVLVKRAREKIAPEILRIANELQK